MLEKIPGEKTSRGASIIALGTLSIASIGIAVWQYFSATDKAADILVQALGILGAMLGGLALLLALRRRNY